MAPQSLLRRLARDLSRRLAAVAAAGGDPRPLLELDRGAGTQRLG